MNYSELLYGENMKMVYKNNQSIQLILRLYKAAAQLVWKKNAKFKDLDNFYLDNEDEEPKNMKMFEPEERMDYYLGGEHPADEWGGMDYNDPDLQPEDMVLKEPSVRFDPKEHLRGGGSIIGKDDSPYIETDEGKHYDIYPDEDKIMDEDEGEIDPLGELHEDIPDFDLTPEDREYLKNLKIKNEEE